MDAPALELLPWGPRSNSLDEWECVFVPVKNDTTLYIERRPSRRSEIHLIHAPGAVHGMDHLLQVRATRGWLSTWNSVDQIAAQCVLFDLLKDEPVQ